MFDNPDASEPNKKVTFFVKSIFFKSSNEICLIFLFLNLADVAIKMSVLFNDFSKFEKTLVFFIISLAPTEVAIILSFGNKG